MPFLLSACRWTEMDPRPAPEATIDIHNHIFNGRDVPVVGFLLQVVMRDPHSDVSLPTGSIPFFLTLKLIMLAGTPTARQELDGFGGAALSAARDPEEQDQAAVAEGLAALAADELGSDPTLERALRGGEAAALRPDESAERQALLAQIAADLGASDQRITADDALRDPEVQAQTLAAEVFRKDSGAAFTAAGRGPGYVHDTPLIATLRWAGMMTRSRAQILDQLVQLYGTANGVKIYSPSLVDMGRWFATDEQVSSIADQLQVFSALAQSRKDVLILPFAPFCPLRAAEQLRGDPNADILQNVRTAITEMGFCGVKLYPPMGFRPLNNSGRVTWAADPNFGDASQFDAPLRALYDWCAQEGVPIKAHANNSIAAGPNSGTMADPAGWQAVLDRPEWAGLHINLAHFGGFEESAPQSALRGPDWEDTLIAMIARYPTLYFDLSYWTEATGGEPAQRQRVLDRMRDLIAADRGLLARMMYGSDWSMIGREPGHQDYFNAASLALEELGLGDTETQAVMGGNAARYLDLVAGSRQRARLDPIYGDNPVYAAHFMT